MSKKRPKPKPKSRKAGRPPERLYIPDVQAALDKMWTMKKPAK